MSKSRFKTLNLLDCIIFSLLLIYILFIVWLNFMPSKIILLINLLIVTRMIIPLKMKKLSITTLVLLLICSLLLLTGSLHDSGVFLESNLKIMFQSGLIILYSSYSIRNNKQFVSLFLEKMYKPLNVYYVINLLIMSIQISHPGFLMANTSNIASYDQITGFIGPDGTHCVSLFTCFIIIFNLNRIVGENRKSYRKLRISYLMVTTIWSAFISTQNDNVSFFILLPLVMIIYMVFLMPDKVTKVFMKIWKPIVIMVVAILCFYFLLSLKIPLLQNLQARINQTIATYFVVGQFVLGTDERSYYFLLALEHGGMIGQGWGSITMFSDKSIVSLFGNGFDSHFGMAAIQPIIQMGGWLFFLLYIFLIVNLFFEKSYAKLVKKLSLAIFLILLAYYTQILIVVRHSIFMCFLIIIIMLIPSRADVINKNHSNIFRRG